MSNRTFDGRYNMIEQKTDSRSLESEDGLHSDTCCGRTCCRAVQRYRDDSSFRQHIMRTGCLYISLFTLGFAKGQIGPSLIDLQIISGVGLGEGSALLTTIYLGYMGGACVGGVIYSRVRKTYILTGAKSLLSVVTLVIPWCSVYWMMVVVFCFFGLSLGVTDSVASGDLQNTWGKDGRPYMQGMQLMYAVGVAVAPLIAAPFLYSPVPPNVRQNESDIDLCVFQSNETKLSTAFSCFNRESYNVSKNGSVSFNHPSRGKTQLYMSYMFTTAFSVIVCLAFVAFYFRFERQSQNTTNELSIPKEFETRKLPKSLKCFTLGMLVSISGLICCIDDTFLGFLTTFCVKYLNWTKPQGAMLTSASSFVVVIGRMLAVVFIQLISPMTLIGVHCFVTMLSFVGLYVSAVRFSSIGVCIASLVFGYGKSAILASVFSWIEEIVSPVTGKISALVFFVITALTAMNPVILGNMMENLTSIWFALLLLGESIVLFVVYTATMVLSRYIIANYGYTYSKRDTTIDITLVEEQDLTSR